MNNGFCWVMAAATTAVFLTCSNPGGIGHEGEAKISGQLMLPDGTSAAQTEVALLPADHDPVKDTALLPRETTDSQGKYHFSKVTPGDYTIVAVHKNRIDRAIISGVRFAGDAVAVPSVALTKMGAMKVMLSQLVSGDNGYIYLPGTMLYGYINNHTDCIIIDSVPAGEIPEVTYASTDAESTTTFEYRVPVVSSDTVIVHMPLQSHHRTLVLNTSATGAGVPGNVTEFPVLVRLNASNFDFSQAQPTGSDIYFRKPDSTLLPHEIERWDAPGGAAEVWVKVDAIFGNDSTQSIIMYWGGGAVIDSSDSAPVFDTANGYAGVWHLGDSTGTMVDATENGYTGTKNGNQTRTAGVIGYGQSYDGTGDYTDMGDVCNFGMSNFTVSAWIRKATPNKIQTIIGKSPGGNPSTSYGWLLELAQDGMVTMFIATGAGTWGTAQTFVLSADSWIIDAEWHHITAVVDRSNSENCRIYLDGADVSAPRSTGDITTIGNVGNASPLRFGTDAADVYSWKGSLDECTVAFRVRSPDWIRLSYMNQREDDKLIGF